MTVPASQAFRQAAEPIWQAQLRHPLVRGIGDGTLPAERFAVWLEQDYLYLIEYARLFALTVARAPNLATMRPFARLLHETLTVEMELHRSYVAEFGITLEDLERAAKLPTTRGYTDFLLRTAALGDYAELLGALLPCMWGYSWLGQELLAAGLPPEERYARWIALYASEEFAELAFWCRGQLDRACADLGEDALARARNAFLTSSRYELAFWEMAWSGEAWPA
jgi:thiaminase/transcriptional activator TenA